MLGSSCSPCCGPPPCTSQAIADFYSLMSSANVVIDIAGSSDERDGATITLGTYHLLYEGGPPQGSTVSFIYTPTVSPIGQLELALSPSETALEQFGPLSVHFARVTFRYINHNFNVLLELIMRPSFFSIQQPISWPGTSCPVTVRLEIRQTAFTYRHNTALLLDPATALTNPNGMGGCAYNMWLTDYVNFLFQDAASPVPEHFGGYDYALPHSLTPVSTWSQTRDYWRTVDHGPVVASVDQDEIILSGERAQTSTIYLPRFIDDDGAGQWYSNIAATQVPEPGVSCGWSITGSSSGKRFAARNLLAFSTATPQHIYTAEQDAAHADITPTVRFSWE